MATTYLVGFELELPGPGNAGLALSAQLYDYPSGNPNGTAITTGFIDLSDADNGYYASFLSIPNHFVGAIKWTRTDLNTGIGIITITPAQNGEMLRRVLGLQGENRVIQPLTRDTTTGETKTGAIRLYDTQANANTDDGATGLIENYPITGGLTNGLLTNGKTTRDGS